MLDPEDLAYMRETQDEARPTAATLLRGGGLVDDGMGGWVPSEGTEQAVTIRLSGPDVVARRVGDMYGPDALRCVLDVVEVRKGDTIRVSDAEAYEVVSEGDPSEWATAQVVYVVRR